LIWFSSARPVIAANCGLSVLGDVWLAFARDPKRRMDLLITPPMHDHAAGPVAMALANALRQFAQSQQMTKRALATYLKDISVAYLRG
jgi:hypothetical protein